MSKKRKNNRPSGGQINKAAPGGVARSLDLNIALQRQGDDATNKTDQMGPGTGLRSTPLDASGEPRLWQYRPGWNLPTQPGEGRVQYNTLRNIADMYDVARKCIEIRKDELCSLPWDITVREPDKRKKRALLEEKRDLIQQVKRRFTVPDMRNSFQTWFRKGLEDFFVLDAMSLSTMRTLGGDVMGWRWLDGATIKPRIDLTGEIPFRPNVAYQQYLYGYPRFDFFESRDPMTYMEARQRWMRGDGGIPDAAPGYQNVEGGFRYPPGELRYRPRNKRNHTVYGFSHVEGMLTHVNIALRWQLWEQAYWVDGNIPSALISVPDDWTQPQIEEFQAWWDAVIAGDPSKQRSVRFVPGGSKFMDTEPALDHSNDFAQWLLTVTLFIFDLNRAEVGLDPLNGEGLGGKGHSEGMAEQNMRASLRPTANWLKCELFDPLIQEDLGHEDLEWIWPSLQQDNEREKAEVNQILLTTGQKSLDQLLAEDGEEPIGIGRIMLLGNQPYSEVDLKKAMESGFLGMQMEQQQQLLERQAKTQQQGAAHQSGLNKDEAEHQSGLNQDEARIQAKLNPKPSPAAKKSAEVECKMAGCDCDESCGPGCGCDCPHHHPHKAAMDDLARAEVEAIMADLRRWETKAIKATKAGKSPQVRFSSDHISSTVWCEVSDALATLDNPSSDDVRSCFRSVRESHGLPAPQGGEYTDR